MSGNVDISKMRPYDGPVSAALFPHLTIVLAGVGLIFTAWFFVYAVTQKKRTVLKELWLAAVASSFLGLGTLFFLLWVGIYV